MRKLMGLKVALLVVCLLTMAAVPATAQLADPLSLAASGVLLPFFSDPASGFVSIFEIASPVIPTTTGFTLPLDFTNPLHAVFFSATCARQKSVADVETSKQAKAYISAASPFLLDFNGLAAIASLGGTGPVGNELAPLHFPIHSRVHWIDVKTGRLRELEPITLDTFLSLISDDIPLVDSVGSGHSVGWGPPLVWNPLRSAATFVTPQESPILKATIYLICPRSSIQSAGLGATNGLSSIFPRNAFPTLFNRDGSAGFPGSQIITGNSVSVLRGRIYDDDETLVRDVQVPCDCLTATPVLAIDGIYNFAPRNLGLHTVPVWYTELESTQVNPSAGLIAGTAQYFSFTGYWGLEVTSQAGTLFHRLSNASLDNLNFGSANTFGNR